MTTPEVTVYSKPNCGDCVATKELLKEIDVPFQEILVLPGSEEMRELKAKKVRQMPYVVTEQSSWTGFNEQKIRDLARAADDYADVWDD